MVCHREFHPVFREGSFLCLRFFTEELLFDFIFASTPQQYKGLKCPSPDSETTNLLPHCLQSYVTGSFMPNHNLPLSYLPFKKGEGSLAVFTPFLWLHSLCSNRLFGRSWFLLCGTWRFFFRFPALFLRNSIAFLLDFLRADKYPAAVDWAYISAAIAWDCYSGTANVTTIFYNS